MELMTRPPDQPLCKAASTWLELRHRRYPKRHEFRYPLFMLWLDLGELDRVFAGRWFWSTRGPNLVWFRRADYGGDPTLPLDEAIRCGGRKDRPAPGGASNSMLTNPRYFGYCFNSISLYYCYGADGQTLEAVVGEVTNTPWGEPHPLCPAPGGQPGAAGEAPVPLPALHALPFLPMDMEYQVLN